MKTILVEYSNEYGQWTWYAVVYAKTLKQALEYYAVEHGCEDPVYTEEKDGMYLDGDEARAYEINIVTL